MWWRMLYGDHATVATSILDLLSVRVPTVEAEETSVQALVLACQI